MGVLPYVQRAREKDDDMANPFQFMQQVRAEAAKVTWPTRREVMLTTAMVLLMSALTAVFFFLIDVIIRNALIATVSAFN